MNDAGDRQLQERIKSVKARIEKLIENGHIDEAKAALQEYDSKMPGDPDICSMFAVIHIIEGSLDKAEEAIFNGLKKDSVQFDLIYNLAYIREQEGLYEEALELYATAGTVANDRMQKQNVDEAVKRLQNINPCLEIKDKTRVVFFVREGLDGFLGDIIKCLKGEYRVRKIIVSDFSQIDEGMEWADICWFEWCDELIVYGSRLPLANKRKIICRLHRYEVFTIAPRKVKWNNVDRLAIVTRHLKDLLDIYHPGVTDQVKIEVVENGVDLSRFSFKQRSDGFNLAMVGYLHSRKNPVLLLQIIRKLVDIDKRYKLYIAGQFQEQVVELYWDYQVRRMGLENNVVFDGWQEDIERWLEDKNYILSTSIHESFGYGIAEAMARGIKPIIHDFPYAYEIWDEELLFRTVDEAVDLIRNNIYESEKYRAIIENRYSLKKQVNHIKNMIEELVSYKQIINYATDILSGKKKAENFMADNLTVFAPCYNRAKMIKEDLDRGFCLSSQPKLFVDDCSDEENRKILKELLDEKEKYGLTDIIFKDKNEGVASALSTGIYNTKTRYMLLKGDDDLVFSTRPSQEIGTMLPGIGVVCPFITPRYVLNLDESGELSLGYDREIFNNQDAHEVLKYMFLTGEMQALIAGTIFLRDDLFGCLPETLFRVSEDYVIVSRVLAGNPNLKVSVTDSIVYIRRVSANTLSRTINDSKFLLHLLSMMIPGFYCMKNGLINATDYFDSFFKREELLHKLYNFERGFADIIKEYSLGSIGPDDLIAYLRGRGLCVSGSPDLPGEVLKVPELFK
ncbi:MAG: glycosyltransferase [Acetivibrionales bacterium]|jgi:glycosyltransferase involved in cell wall biosynthesis